MRPPVEIKVSGRQLAWLEENYKTTPNVRMRLRIQMVLLSRAGYSVKEIAGITRKSDDSVRYWLHRFKEGGCGGLQEARHTGRPAQIIVEMEAFLRECILQSPREYGIERPGWTTALLAQAVKRRWRVSVSAECIRQHLQRVEAVCRRRPGRSNTWQSDSRDILTPALAGGAREKRGSDTVPEASSRGVRRLCSR
jgi:transposase